MDTPDASVYSATTKRQREQLPKTSLQQELNAKMKERKKLGLSADLTSEESSGLDSEEENSLTMEFRARTTIRSDRPSSAKRRGKLDLGDTLKPGEANRFLKTAKKDQMSTLRESPPLKGSSGFPKDNSPGRDIDKMFGTLGSKGRTSPSPLDSRFGMDTVDAPIYSAKHRKSPAEDGMLTGSRKSPVSPSLGLLPSGKNAPARELTKEEKIFGVKTGPGKDRESPKEKEWKAPNFRQSPVLGQERATPSPDIGKAGRKTPDIGLQTITESPRPVPRTLAKDTKLKSRDSSPRSLSLESPKSERPKPKVDIFGGKKDKTIEFADEPEKTPSSRERRRFGREEKPVTPGRKTPTKAGESTGRTTPTLRKSPALSGRLTPTSAKASKTAEEPKKKEPGLFDFLTEDKKDDKKEEKKESTPKPRLGRDRRQTNLKKSESHDSITEELGAADQPSILEESTRDQRIPVDQSSVCADLDKDPDRERVRKEEKEKQFAGYSNQRSDRKEAADIISRVEDAQSHDPKQMTKQRPASAKADTLVKPQPRHSLPGSRPSSAVASERLEMFNTTMSIRQTIFEEWRKAKAKEIKQKKLEEEKKKEAEEKKKQKEKQDKVLENRASYEAWMKERGKSFVEEQKLKKKEEEKKLKKEEEEKHNKKKDAKKNFEKWKESKDALIIEEHKKAIEEKYKKKQEERAKQKDKEKTNETAFKGWKERKDKVIEQNVAKQKEAKLEIKKKEEEEQKEKERQAMRDYNDWLKKKEEQERREADFRRTQQIREEHGEAEFRPPWSPASKIIPCGR